MCHRKISMYVKNFVVGYQFTVISIHHNREHLSTSVAKNYFQDSVFNTNLSRLHSYSRVTKKNIFRSLDFEVYYSVSVTL